MDSRAVQKLPHPKGSAVDPLLNKVVAGRYRLESRLGEGGMGVVYRARHVLIERVVALKLIRPDLRGETHLRAWMLREARAANRVDHAHIIDIHDIGETEEGELYLVMEYLVGTPLSAELGRGPMPIARGVDILEQMCAALARAHDLGVVHRDLKSDNILLTHRGGRKDFVKILDFGLAAIARDARLAPKGAVFGTPEYMSPEQARGEEAGPQSDLYALGVLFFEMLTGQLPFRSPDRDTLLEMQRTHLPPHPRTIRPDAHAQGQAIVMRLLEKDVRKRYRDAHHLQEDLKALQRSLPTQAWDLESGEAAPPPPPPPPQSPGVIEWASRAALFSRMASRAYPLGNAPAEIELHLVKAWDLASRANKLEGEVASYSRKLENLERKSRAYRAEIGRKVEELAHEESRVMREAAADGEDADKVRAELSAADQLAANTRQLADSALRQNKLDPQVFERAGAAAAAAQAKREQLARYEAKKAAREAIARDLRRQIDGFRAQLVEYAEGADAAFVTSRELITQRTREGVTYERSFSDASNALLAHLRTKPECRDLVSELLETKDAPSGNATGHAEASALETKPSDRRVTRVGG
jgi:serine/threonine-protein kinase